MEALCLLKVRLKRWVLRNVNVVNRKEKGVLVKYRYTITPFIIYFEQLA